MKTIKQYLKEGFADNYGVGNSIKIAVTNKDIHKIVKSELKRLGNNANLNHIDVSQVTNMDRLFSKSKFDGDISEWDVSNVTNMQGMFQESKFTGKNGDISNWNVVKLTAAEYMFEDSKFTGDITKWGSKMDTEDSELGCMLLNCPAKHPRWYEDWMEDNYMSMEDYLDGFDD